MRFVLPLLVPLALAPIAWAEDHGDMQAAREALESARSHLESAGREYSGHRQKALERVNQALEQIKLGLAATEGVDKRIDRREGHLERLDDRIEKRIEDLKQRQDQRDVR